MSIKNKVNTRKAMALAAVFAFAMILLVACGGQQGSTQGNGAESSAVPGDASVVDSATAPIASDGFEERPVRVAVTNEDYSILRGASDNAKIIRNGQEMISNAWSFASEEEEQKNVFRMGNTLVTSKSEVNSEYGYYETDNLGNVFKTLYYPISGLPIFERYGHLIGTYGDIPVLEVDSNVDAAQALLSKELTAHKCKLVGCSVAWIANQSSIWNGNDLIPVANPDSLQLVDTSGEPGPNPMCWDFGEEIIAEFDDQSLQLHVDSYIYLIDDESVEIGMDTIKVSRNGRTVSIETFDLTKLNPGLYYFEGLGVYKIV